MNCKLSDIQLEIKAMQLNREWSNNILKFSKTIERYPEVLFISTGEELARIASSFGADMWHDTANTITSSLRDGLSVEDFVQRCDLTIYGYKDLDIARHALAQKYEELHDKFFVQHNAVFAYRLAEHISPKLLTFNRISNLEIIEYALRRNRLATWDGTTGNLFGARGHADAGAHEPSPPSQQGHEYWWGGTERRATESITQSAMFGRG